MSDELASALSASLHRLERGGHVDDAWLMSVAPHRWQEVRRALETEAALNGGISPGTVLHRYRVETRLGTGGMGTVYRASVIRSGAGLRPGDVVALKVVHPDLVDRHPVLMSRLLREVATGSRIRHAGIVRVHEAQPVAVADRTLHVLSMELVEGRTLRREIQERGALDEEECRAVARQILAALGHLHALGIVHRDVKPANLMRTPDGRVVLLDLGVAWLRDELGRLSSSGQFVGSLMYAAPEQFIARLGPPTGRTDLYALGATLYELTSGRSPWDPELVGVRPGSGAELAPPPLGAIAAVSGAFARVVDRLLCANPRDRFANAADTLLALDEGVSDSVARPRQGPGSTGKTIAAALAEALDRARDGAGSIIVALGVEGDAPAQLADRVRRGAGGADWISEPSGGALLSRLGGDDLPRSHASLFVRRRLFQLSAAGPVVVLVGPHPAEPPDVMADLCSPPDALNEAPVVVVWMLRQRERPAWLSEWVLRSRTTVLAAPDERTCGGPGRVSAVESAWARLSADEVELLRRASDLGWEFDPDVLARRLGQEPLGVRQALTHVARTSRVIEWSGSGFRFTSDSAFQRATADRAD